MFHRSGSSKKEWISTLKKQLQAYLCKTDQNLKESDQAKILGFRFSIIVVTDKYRDVFL